MLKHMLTQTGGSLPATPAARTGNIKLATRANSSVVDAPTIEELIHAKSILSPTMASNGGGRCVSPPLTLMNGRPTNSIHHANLTLNQSIYANTIAVPKMNGILPSAAAAAAGKSGKTVTTSTTSSSSGSNAVNTNAMNTSKLSSSASPATTNQTKTSYMDSSRDQSHHELESTTLSPISRSQSQRPPQQPRFAGNTSVHSNKSDIINGDHSLLRPPHNSTIRQQPNGGLNLTSNTRIKRLNASQLLPANVSKFMLLSKEAGVRVVITSLALLCLVSLLFALLSLVFLLKISPPSEEDKEEANLTSIYEVTLALCALTLSLNLCCLLVCAIQFLFAVKLVKSPQGKTRTTKYLREASATRICAIGGFFISIPIFLTGVILYTFLHFDSTPAIVSAIVIGLGIVFCGGAVVHNVFVWQKEKSASHSKSTSTSPVLGRNQVQLDGTNKTGTFVGLPQATLDLSGHNSTSRVLELSTLV